MRIIAKIKFVEQEITGTWTRYLAEISWFRAQTARALRPSRLSLRPSQVYKEAADELYDKVFLKLGTLDQKEWPDLNHGCWSTTPPPRSIDSNTSGF